MNKKIFLTFLFLSFLFFAGVANAQFIYKGNFINNTEYDNGICTTSKTIDPANGNRQKVTLTHAQTCVLTFTQPSSGTVGILLKVVQDTTSAYDGAISGTIRWPGAEVPIITKTAGAVDIISCYLDGTYVYCVPSQDFR
jgi:hypothetical protein